MLKYVKNARYFKKVLRIFKNGTIFTSSNKHVQQPTDNRGETFKNLQL